MRKAPFARPRLVVMAKAPRLGQVKTRLGREIGRVAALRLARTLLTHTLLRLGRDPRWELVLALAPDSAASAGRARRPGIIGQGRGDLGPRMRRLLNHRGPTILIGTDIPSLRPHHVAHAVRLLAGADAVFGPATDGGFWLVGRRGVRLGSRTFADVRWSSPHALADTLRTLDRRTVRSAALLDDLDDAEAYRRLGRIAERLISPARAPSFPDADAPPASA